MDEDIFGKFINIILVLSVLFIPSIGLSYKFLRFAVNHKVSSTTVVKCNKKLRALDETKDYFQFEIFVDSINYPITKRSRSKTFKLKPQPKFDWCKFEGEKITVYHYDKLELATIFKNDSQKKNIFRLAWNMESGRAVIGLILLPFLILISASMGLIFLTFQISLLFEEIKNNPPKAHHKFILGITWINRYFMNIASIVLAIVLIALLGVVMVKGMLYLEGSNNFLMGVLLILGLNIALFGPGLLVLGVHKIRTTSSQLLVLFRNIIFVGVLFKLVLGLTDLLKQQDFSEFNDLTIFSFFMKVVKVLLEL